MTSIFFRYPVWIGSAIGLIIGVVIAVLMWTFYQPSQCICESFAK